MAHCQPINNLPTENGRIRTYKPDGMGEPLPSVCFHFITFSISSAVIFYKPRLNSIACSVFIRTLLRYLTLTLRHAPTCYVSRREPNELTEHYRADSLWRTALPFARVRIHTLHNAIVNNSSLVVLSMRLMCLSVYIFRHLAEQGR